jgi:hypothetical protein
MMREWIHKIIEGVGGFHDFERYEMALPNIPRDEAIAGWVIQCLINPKCVGSEEILQEIIRHRQNIKS